MGEGSSAFLVKYDASFTEASGNVNRGQPANSFGKFKFMMHRGGSLNEGASDGAFMYDKTVLAVLFPFGSTTAAGTHSYGTFGGVLLNVLINTSDPQNPYYETHFKRGNLIDPNTGLAPISSGTYVLKVFVLDVDGTWMEQAASSPVTF